MIATMVIRLINDKSINFTFDDESEYPNAEIDSSGVLLTYDKYHTRFIPITSVVFVDTKAIEPKS